MLVKLKDTKGNTVYINPTHVMLVAAGGANGVVTVGETAIVLHGGPTLSIAGSPDEVVRELGETHNPEPFPQSQKKFIF